MLKYRIIPIQLLLDGRLVKTRNFNDYRDVGDPIASSRVYNSQYADELIFVNIAREGRSIKPMLSLIEAVSEVCFMPLTLGGGVRTSDEAAALIKNGADKVAINTASYRNPQILSDMADRYGSQAVQLSIDARWDSEKGRYILYSDCGRAQEDVSVEEHISRCIERGAGEVFVQSIDRDGTMEGYDIDLIKLVSKVANVPVVAGGGSGNYRHLRQAFEEGEVTAVACGSLFNFSDSNPIRAKSYLANHRLPVKVV